jgi:hypothetical protein
MPVNLEVKKISSCVLASCKMHKYCIDKRCEEIDAPIVIRICLIF